MTDVTNHCNTYSQGCPSRGVTQEVQETLLPILTVVTPVGQICVHQFWHLFHLAVGKVGWHPAKREPRLRRGCSDIPISFIIMSIVLGGTYTNLLNPMYCNAGTQMQHKFNMSTNCTGGDV